MTALTRWVLAHRRLVVVAWVLLTVVGAATVSQATRGFSKTFGVPGREGFIVNRQIISVFGAGGHDAPLLAVVTLPGATTVRDPSVVADLGRLDARIARILPGARIASFATTRSSAFVSRDGHTTFAIAYPRPLVGASFGQNTVAARALTASLAGATVAGAPVRVTGVDALGVQTGGGRGPGVFLESVFGGLGALAVLAVVFASLLAFVPIVMAVVAIMTTFLVLYGVSQAFSVSFIVEFLVGLIGLGVAIDYALLVVVRWREERAREGASDEEAVVAAMSTAGRAVVFSGTTVAIGLLALIVLPLPFLRSIGVAGMLIPLVSVLVAITLLPVVLVSLGSRLDWPHRRTDRDAGARWLGWASGVVRLRWPAAIGAGAVLVALLIAATGLNPGTSNVDTLARSGEAHAGLVQLERSGIGAGALQPIEVLVRVKPSTETETIQSSFNEANPSDLYVGISRRGGLDPSAVANRLDGVDGIHGAVAPTGLLWQRGPLAVVDAYPVPDNATSAGADTLDAAIAAAHSFGRGVRVGGVGSENKDFNAAIYGNFPVMIALIAVLTFLLLARAFRSIVLPLKAVALNVVSVAAAWGVMTLVWQEGHGSHLIYGIAATHSITSWIPLMVFAFLFGLSMDYEVFILARVREEYDATGSTDAAVVTGLGRTGRLVTSAALILFLAFVSMSSGPETDIKVFATGLAAGILLDATVIRALLVPAMVSLFGRWNWWLPASLARVLRVEPSVPLPEPSGA